MKIAIEGCCHGELDKIYSHVAYLEKKNNYKVDLLLICGDFQAIRNHADLQCMAVPPKYRQLGGFYRYYTGEKVAPVPTILIGGNHESSNYLWELYHGGFLAPNIYYLGFTGCVRFNGVRIAGSSGIYKEHHYGLGHSEFLPYTDSSMRSIYHTRLYGVTKLMQLATTPLSLKGSEDRTPEIEPVDILLSHDWPQSIAYHGDTDWLLRTKPFFKKDVETGQLGSPPMMQLLRTVKPKRWFSAHLHVKFGAKVDHSKPAEVRGTGPGRGRRAMPAPETRVEQAQPSGDNPDEILIDDDDTSPAVLPSQPASGTQSQPLLGAEALDNPDEIQIDDEEFEPEPTQAKKQAEPAILPEESSSKPEPVGIAPETASNIDPLSSHAPSPDVKITQFLALDKCLPNRQFLEVIDIPIPPKASDDSSPTLQLTYDPQWLAICRAFHPYLSLSRSQSQLPSPSEARELVLKELKWIEENVGNNRCVEEVQKFLLTAPGPSNGGKGKGGKGNQWQQKQPPAYLNPQTEAFCHLIGVENKINTDGLQIFAPAKGKATGEGSQ